MNNDWLCKLLIADDGCGSVVGCGVGYFDSVLVHSEGRYLSTLLYVDNSHYIEM